MCFLVRKRHNPIDFPHDRVIGASPCFHRGNKAVGKASSRVVATGFLTVGASAEVNKGNPRRFVAQRGSHPFAVTAISDEKDPHGVAKAHPQVPKLGIGKRAILGFDNLAKPVRVRDSPAMPLHPMAGIVDYEEVVVGQKLALGAYRLLDPAARGVSVRDADDVSGKGDIGNAQQPILDVP